MGLSSTMKTYDIFTCDLGEEFRLVAWGVWFTVNKVKTSYAGHKRRRRPHHLGDLHLPQQQPADYRRHVKKQLLFRQLERDLEDVSDRLRRSPRD